jgi:ribosomal protein L16/L10AE
MKFFKKKHLLVNYKLNNHFINKIRQGQFALYFNKGGILNIDAYRALIFFLKKNLKFFSKLFIRVIPNIQNTKRSIGIRMGKGKGSLNEYYMNISRGQIFLEFGFSNKLLNLNSLEKRKLVRRLRKIIFLSSLKTNIKFRLIKNNILCQ